MQWTDEDPPAYAEGTHGEGYGYRDGYGYGDGYGSTYAHAPAYGYDGGGSATGTVTMPWDPAGLAAPAGHLPGMDPFATPPAGEPLAPEVAAAPDTADGQTLAPVFVDASGRRQRRVRRTARLLLIPAGGYVVLLAGTLLGGPAVTSPFVPPPSRPDPAAHAPEPSPDVSAAASRPAASRHPATTTRPSVRPTATTATTAPVTSAGTATAAPSPTATPTRQPPGLAHKPLK